MTIGYKYNFLFLFIFHLIGLYLFKEGFLLSRLELDQKSGSSAPAAQRPKARYEKTLLVMIDALRFDFLKWEEGATGNDVPHYINKMPIIKTKLEKEPRNSLLFRGISDPPTTTLQRLMAIMTGALPTLVDAGSNFASSALKEDNLIEKILISGKRVVSLGDDTWDRLFPTSINESYFYPSFDVWDLHSVDLGVLEHLIPMLNQPEHDWGLLIAHFLGVDHAGHRYGPGHVAMGDKLVQMNTVLGEIFEKVHPDTLVIVMGDHGMDKKGDHGGDSDQETNAGLFFYSKTPLTQPSLNMDNLLDGIQAIDKDYYIFSKWKGDRTLQQIDLVPTLASLMGLDIPFGNLGTIIPEFFVDQQQKGLKVLLETMAVNAKQLFDYLEAYSEKRSDAKAAFSKSRTIYHQVKEMHSKLRDQYSSSASEKSIREQERELYLKYTYFMRHTLLVARAIWTRFEHTLMAMGSIILFLSLFMALRMYTADQIDYYSFSIGIFNAALGGLLGLFSPIRRVAYPGLKELATITLQPVHESLFFAFLALGCTWFIFSKQRLGETTTLAHITSRTATVIILLYSCTLGSDSFLIFEDFVLLHFIQFIHAILAIHELYKQHRKNGVLELSLPILKIIAVAVIIRVISLVTICRPDQGPYCVATYNASPTSSISALWTLIPVWILFIATIWSLKSHSISFKALFSLSLLCTCLYWTIDTLENYSLIPEGAVGQNKFIFAYLYWAIIAVICLSAGTKQNALEIGFLFLIMFQKPMGMIVLFLLYHYIQLSRDFTCSPQLLYLVGWVSFFSTGHQNILATIQYDVGFIGLENANFVLSPLFVALNTFGGPILVTLSYPTLSVDAARSWRIIWTRQLAFAVFFNWYFCRHSQAFRVWAPKFLFYSAGHVLCSISYLIFLNLKDGLVQTDDGGKKFE